VIAEATELDRIDRQLQQRGAGADGGDGLRQAISQRTRDRRQPHGRERGQSALGGPGGRRLRRRRELGTK